MEYTVIMVNRNNIAPSLDNINKLAAEGWIVYTWPATISDGYCLLERDTDAEITDDQKAILDLLGGTATITDSGGRE